MRFSAIRMWGQAILFFFRHIIVLAPLAPLPLVPFVADLFTAPEGQAPCQTDLGETAW
jgi:hypothetical protein